MASDSEGPRLGLIGATLQLWALLLGIALLLAGNGLQGTLLGVVAEDSGFSSAVTGFVMTCFYAGFMLGSLGAERLIARVGHVRTFAALASAGSIAILIHGLAIEPGLWALMRFITGFSFAGLYVVAESWLARQSDNDYRGGLLAVYMIVQHAGLAGGQLLMNTAPTTGLALYVITSIIISAALIPILLSSAPQPHVVIDVERLSLTKLFGVSPLGVAGCFGAGLANGIILGMSAVYARRLGLDIAAISVFVAAIMVGGAAFQWPVGKLSDRMDRRRVIAGVAGLTAIAALALVPAAALGGVALFTAGFVAGGLALTIYPLSLAHTNDWLKPEQMTASASTLVMVYGAGAVLGPIGAGAFMGWIGPDGFALYLAAIAACLAAYAAYRIPKRAAPQSTEGYRPVGAVAGSGEYLGEVWDAADDEQE
ncbi:MFS transporter [Maricaulaceae bacterium MS644]